MKTTPIVVGIALVVAVGFGVYQARRAAGLKEEVRTLEQRQREAADLGNEARAPASERAEAQAAVSNAPAPDATPSVQKGSGEVLRLRGEVGRLRTENASIASSNAVSKITANPEARKLLRDQQKLGMSAIYRGFARGGSLAPEQSEKLNDLLADHIMNNVDRVTTALRDKASPEQVNAMFEAEEAALAEQVKELLGEEGLQRFREYTTGLLGSITADQFKGMLSGDDAARQAKSKQLAQAIQEETQAVLTSAGLPPDYQTIPMLNFRNIASEQEGDRSLKLLDDIYQRVAARGSAFLSPEEIKKFDEFRTTGVNNNRAALMINRTMMAPISQ